MGFNIVEFNGIPGSGKTTISRELEKELKNKSLKIINEKDIFNDNNKVSNLFCLKNAKINMTILLLAIDILIKNRQKGTLINAIKIIRYNNIIYKNYKNKEYDYIILSEGMIQFLSSLFDNNKYDNKKNISKIAKGLSRIYRSILYVNCDIRESEAFLRISNRTSKPNSVDLMDRNELGIFLEERKYALESIRMIFDSLNCNITLNTEDSIKKNIKIILKQIGCGG